LVRHAGEEEGQIAIGHGDEKWRQSTPFNFVKSIEKSEVSAFQLFVWIGGSVRTSNLTAQSYQHSRECIAQTSISGKTCMNAPDYRLSDQPEGLVDSWTTDHGRDGQYHIGNMRIP
jgi:hypothetical protein